MVISISLGALAAFAPAVETVTVIPQTEIAPSFVTPLSEPVPTQIDSLTQSTPVISPTPKLEELINYFDAPNLEKPFTYTAFDIPPEIKDSFLYLKYQAGKNFGSNAIVIDPDGKLIVAVVAFLEVDVAAPLTYAYIQTPINIGEQRFYTNFGLTDTGDCFVSISDDSTLIDVEMQTFTTQHIDNITASLLAISFGIDDIEFFCNDNIVYTLKTSTQGSQYVTLNVGGSDGGYIESRWDEVGLYYARK